MTFVVKKDYSPWVFSPLARLYGATEAVLYRINQGVLPMMNVLEFLQAVFVEDDLGEDPDLDEMETAVYAQALAAGLSKEVTEELCDLCASNPMMEISEYQILEDLCKEHLYR